MQFIVVVLTELQFLVHWYQQICSFSRVVSVNRLAVPNTVVSVIRHAIYSTVISRCAVSSTVVSADLQFLVEWYQLTDFQFLIQRYQLTDFQFLIQWYQLTDMPFTYSGYQSTDVQSVVQCYHLGNLHFLVEE